MKKLIIRLLLLYTISIFHFYTFAQNVGIGIAEPINKLHVLGNLLVNAPYSSTNTEPTAAQTKTMINSTTVFFSGTDSTGRVYDPGGSDADYINNMTAYVLILNNSNSRGYELTLEDADLGTGDSLIIMVEGNPIPFIAVGNGYTATGKWIINGVILNIVFKSNNDGINGRGFKLVFRRLFDNTASQPPLSGYTGKGLFFDTKNGAFRAGGFYPAAIGSFSVAIGNYTIASGDYSSAMGSVTTASGVYSSALGFGSRATGHISTSMGYSTNASGENSTALGSVTTASGYVSTTMGQNTRAIGANSTAIGINTLANNGRSTAMGNATIASGYISTAMGNETEASGNNSTAMGNGTIASGYASTAMGSNTIANISTSTAMGESSKATGSASTAMGNGTSANGANSTAMGNSTIAGGINSTAMGNNTRAYGDNSTAMGTSIASGNTSTSMGFNTTASNYFSVATGGSTTASGYNSTAMGNSTTASGNYSTAMGNTVSTSGYEGAFVIGDFSTATVMQSFVANGFRARFANGYRLFTNSAANIGAFLNANANSWAALSDVRLKENFIPVDGEAFLNNIANMPLTTWNYKGQDAKTLRHYGPMAQDFYKAFGKDKLGDIGCDTLINQQDFLGVNLIAIQALEKRTTTLIKENKELKNEVNDLKARIEKLELLMAKH